MTYQENSERQENVRRKLMLRRMKKIPKIQEGKKDRWIF